MEPLLGTGLHAGLAERRVHRDGAIRRALLRSAGHRAGLGEVFLGGILQLAFQVPAR